MAVTEWIIPSFVEFEQIIAATMPDTKDDGAEQKITNFQWLLLFGAD